MFQRGPVRLPPDDATDEQLKKVNKKKPSNV